MDTQKIEKALDTLERRQRDILVEAGTLINGLAGYLSRETREKVCMCDAVLYLMQHSRIDQFASVQRKDALTQGDIDTVLWIAAALVGR